MSDTDALYRSREAELLQRRISPGLTEEEDEQLTEELGDLWWQLTHEERAAAHARARSRAENRWIDLDNEAPAPEIQERKEWREGDLQVVLTLLPAPAPELRGGGWGCVRVQIGDHVIWDGSEPWSLVDMLAFLGEHWPYLQYEELPPSAQRLEWDEQNALDNAHFVYPHPTRAITRREYEAEGRNFLERHNLGRSLHGHRWPDLWLLREGNDMVLSWRQGKWRGTARSVLALWEAVGAALCDGVRLETATPAQAAVNAWHQRNDQQRGLEAFTGFTSATLHDIAKTSPHPNTFWGNPEMPALPAIAARVSGNLPHKDRLLIIEAILSSHSSPLDPHLEALRRQSISVLRALEDLPARPHRQGYKMARWLRQQLHVGHDAYFDVEARLHKWGVSIRDLPPIHPALDAVVCFEDPPGPTILLNPDGQHVLNSPGGRRATLAHELAHLLFDLGHSLPVIEVLGGRTPKPVEQRARAFAAELLVPQSVAQEILIHATDVRAAHAEVCRRYIVSGAVSAWQILNGTRQNQVLTIEDQAWLRRRAKRDEQE